MYALVDDNNICTGYSSKKTESGVLFKAHGLKWNGEEWVDPKDLNEYKNDRIAMVKVEAEERITALNWEKERATEQPELYSLPDVLKDRQFIRDNSSQAEVDIEVLTTIEEVKRFVW